jgi:hypothetical protein
VFEPVLDENVPVHDVGLVPAVTGVPVEVDGKLPLTKIEAGPFVLAPPPTAC